MTSQARTVTIRRFGSAAPSGACNSCAGFTRASEDGLGSVIKKRRKKMRKHKKRKLLRRARHKRKR